MSKLDALSGFSAQQQLELARIESLQKQASGTEATPPKEEVVKAAKDFESLLLKQMLDNMWKTVSDSGLLSGSREEELYRDFMNQKLSEDLAESPGLGLSEMIIREMEKRGKQ